VCVRQIEITDSFMGRFVTPVTRKALVTAKHAALIDVRVMEDLILELIYAEGLREALTNPECDELGRSKVTQAALRKNITIDEGEVSERCILMVRYQSRCSGVIFPASGGSPRTSGPRTSAGGIFRTER